MCLTETWLNSDSIAASRLHAADFNVVDRPRPQACHDLSVNHGGILLFSYYRVIALPFDSPSSFELLVIYVVFGRRRRHLQARICSDSSTFF